MVKGQQQPTCGQGLAEHAVIPASFAAVIAALTENLEAHLETLDLSDANARVEQDVYARLAEAYRTIGARLRVTADEMAGYQNLALGRHKPAALAGPKVRAAFEHFVKSEKEMLATVKDVAARHEQMLGAMRSSERHAVPGALDLPQHE